MNPWRITIDTNPDLCNLHCKMCDTHSLYNKDFTFQRKSMPKEMLERILDDAAESGVKEIIPTTMGEPLLFPSFDVFLNKVHEHNMKLNLTTNGTFPNGGVSYWAHKILSKASDVKISLNGINPQVNENIMVGSQTQSVLANIQEFVAVRDEIVAKGENFPTVTLQVTFMKSNLDELENIIKFAVENNIDRVKGHHLWVTWKELEGESIIANQELTRKWNLLIENLKPYRKMIKLDNFSKLDFAISKNEIPDSYECPFLGNELWVDHEGKYNVCCAPSNLREQLGDFSSSDKLSIHEVFNSEGYVDLVKSYRAKSICSKCLLRRKP